MTADDLLTHYGKSRNWNGKHENTLLANIMEKGEIALIQYYPYHKVFVYYKP